MIFVVCKPALMQSARRREIEPVHVGVSANLWSACRSRSREQVSRTRRARNNLQRRRSHFPAARRGPETNTWYQRSHWSDNGVRSCGCSSAYFTAHIAGHACLKCEDIARRLPENRVEYRVREYRNATAASLAGFVTCKKAVHCSE
jgi:hypothetical protein